MSAPDVHPPGPVVAIARRLEDAGFETWCVGGGVRDALLGHRGLDWDLATAATPDQVRRLFRRTIPVGVEFGTVGVLDETGRMHEVTTFRHDVQTDGRHAVVAFGASLDEDLARRDFTINAIAWSPTRRRLHDPFGGRDDLARRLVRAVGEPERRMAEDRLRALRGIRFAARFDFDIEPATWAAIVASAPHLGRLSAERVKQEIEKTLEQAARPAAAFARWRESGALDAVVPALASIDDLGLATLDLLPPPTLAGRPGRRVLRLAALLMDLGGARAEVVLRALRFSKADTAWVGGLAELWTRLGPEMAAELADGRVSDARLRRWAALAGRTRVAALVRLAAARWAAARAAGLPAPDAAVVRAHYRRLVRTAYRDPIAVGDLAVDGGDLRRAGVAPGPALGRYLHRLLDAVLEDPALNEPGALVDLVRRWLADDRDAAGGPAPTH